MKTFEKYLFLVIFSLGFFGIIGIVPKIISIFLWLSALIYLSFGWILLSPLKGKKLELIPFLISYLIAQTIVTVTFGINNFPLKAEFTYITTGLLLIAIILLSIFSQDLTKSYPLRSYLVRLVICIMFSVTPLWSDIIHAG